MNFEYIKQFIAGRNRTNRRAFFGGRWSLQRQTMQVKASATKARPEKPFYGTTIYRLQYSERGKVEISGSPLKNPDSQYFLWLPYISSRSWHHLQLRQARYNGGLASYKVNKHLEC